MNNTLSFTMSRNQRDVGGNKQIIFYNDILVTKSRDQRDDGGNKQIIFHNDVLVSKLNHSLLRNPPYKLTLAIEELIKPSSQHQSKSVPRPPNGYILYRKDFGAKARLEGSNLTIQELSKLSAVKWQKEDAVVKSFFKILAEIQGLNHHKEYPDYKYSPRSKRIEKSPGERTRFKKLSESNKCDKRGRRILPKNSNSVNNNNGNSNIGDNFDNKNNKIASTLPGLSECTSILALPHDNPDGPKFYLLRRGSLKDELLNGRIARILDPSNDCEPPQSNSQHNAQPQASDNLVPQSSESELDVSISFLLDPQNYDFDFHPNFTIENPLEPNKNDNDDNGNDNDNDNDNNNNNSDNSNNNEDDYDASDFMQWVDFHNFSFN